MKITQYNDTGAYCRMYQKRMCHADQGKGTQEIKMSLIFSFFYSYKNKIIRYCSNSIYSKTVYKLTKILIDNTFCTLNENNQLTVMMTSCWIELYVNNSEIVSKKNNNIHNFYLFFFFLIIHAQPKSTLLYLARFVSIF